MRIRRSRSQAALERKKIPLKDRLLKYIKIEKGKLETDCWNWQARKDSDGYGKSWLDRKCIRAHRASYLVFKGEIPKGLWILHKCDNPSCINPDHLYAGTQADNDKDSHERDLFAIGERNPKAILTNQQVIEICHLLNGKKMLQRDIARNFKIDEQIISHIKHRRNWKKISKDILTD